MARILITSGPTRQHLDPVRYLSNASSGKMGACLAAAAIDRGHDVIIVSGPVAIDYPTAATVVAVTSTQEMLDAAVEHFPTCDGVIGAAAPCDYQPAKVTSQKIKKTGQPISIELMEAPDILKALGELKQPGQWSVAFALEIENGKQNAIAKLAKKNSDLIVLNGPTAINANETRVEILAADGTVVDEASGSKQIAAHVIIDAIEQTIAANKLHDS